MLNVQLPRFAESLSRRLACTLRDESAKSGDYKSCSDMALGCINVSSILYLCEWH
jgi:hypothetical protein